MGKFWKNLFTCYLFKGVNSESEDSRRKKVDKPNKSGNINTVGDVLLRIERENEDNRRKKEDDPNKSGNKTTVGDVLLNIERENEKKRQTKKWLDKIQIADETLTINGRKIINTSPKVIISKVLLKQHSLYESNVFAGSLDDRPVAIRTIKKEFNLEAVKESELLMKLDNHENIIKFHFKFENIEQIYIITEFYDTSLEDYIKMDNEHKSLSAKQICLQLTKAVDFMHKQKVLYLNLNPHNIHIVGSNGMQKIKLTNFKSARLLTDKNTTRTADGSLLNGFIAPEQHLSHEKQFISTDIYMLGCTFYYIITNGLKLNSIKNQNQENGLFGALRSYQANNKSSDVILGLDITLKMLYVLKPKRTSTAMILKHPYFWSTEELLNYIIEVSIRIEEKDMPFLRKLESRSKYVVGCDWTIELKDIYEDISNTRNYNGRSVKDLVQAIRNRIVHTSTTRVLEVMGSSKDDLKNYWLEMFPHLIPHLYNTMNMKHN